MFKNKKEKVTDKTETFNFDTINTPPFAPTKEIKTVKKVKKKNEGPNVLWARILIAIIIVFTLFLSFYKFVDYLNKPMELFNSVVEKTYADLSNTLANIQQNELYKIIKMNKLSIDSDIKLEIDNLDEKYDKIKENLNKLSFTSNIAVDNATNYKDITLLGKINDVEKVNATFIEDNKKNYLNIKEIDERFISLGNSKLNYLAFDAVKTQNIVEVIKPDIHLALSEKDFNNEQALIALNNKNIDCNKISYNISKLELATMLNKVITVLNSNSISIEYIAKLYGIQTKNVEDTLSTLFKNVFYLNEASEYILAAYTNKENDSPVRLELSYKDALGNLQTIFGYNMAENYKKIDYLHNGSNKSIIINEMVNAKNISILGYQYTITVACQKKSDDISIALKVIDYQSGDNILDINVSQGIEAQKNDLYALSTVIDITDYKLSKEPSYSFNISSLANGKTPIEKKTYKNEVKLESFTKEKKASLKNIIKDMVENLEENPIIDSPIEDIPTPDIFEPIEDDNKEDNEIHDNSEDVNNKDSNNNVNDNNNNNEKN